MEFSRNILQEIENDSKALLEELSLFSEEEVKQQPVENSQNQNQQQQPQPSTNNNPTNNHEVRQKKLLKKSNDLMSKIKKSISNQDYLLNGFGYHSQILYKICTKFPLIGKTIGVPLMAITKTAVNNLPPLGRIEREKILNMYTKLKGDREAVNAKLEMLERLKKPNKAQKEEILLLKKMSSELDMNIKRLEFNFKLSHYEEYKAKGEDKRPKNYTF